MTKSKHERQLKSQERSRVLVKLIQYLHYSLNHDREALEYLRKRKLNDQTIAKFQIGACPSLERLLANFSQLELMQAGVVRVDESGQASCKFKHNRLILPTFDVWGQPIALTGRVLCGEKEREILGVPKYDNTVFDKSRHLYGLNLAKKAVLEKGAVLIVEGNFDVIAAVQAGVENVVASCGAYVSRHQIALASRYAERIYLGLDADEAGMRGMERVFKRPAPEGVVLRQKNVPAGFKDWDEWFGSKVVG